VIYSAVTLLLLLLLLLLSCRHNGRTLGYEPWNVGFTESWFPPMASEDALVS
jgi:hypothetical protein